MIRKQMFINEKEYTKNMITHHSMAILMSKQILKKSKDPFIVNLANNIIKAQYKEIDEMKQYNKKK